MRYTSTLNPTLPTLQIQTRRDLKEYHTPHNLPLAAFSIWRSATLRIRANRIRLRCQDK